MRGDATWFKDVVETVECALRLEHLILDTGRSYLTDTTVMGWFKFHALDTRTKRDCAPVWMRETFKHF